MLKGPVNVLTDACHYGLIKRRVVHINRFLVQLKRGQLVSYRFNRIIMIIYVDSGQIRVIIDRKWRISAVSVSVVINIFVDDFRRDEILNGQTERFVDCDPSRRRFSLHLLRISTLSGVLIGLNE